MRSILPLTRICAAQSTGSANWWLRFKTARIPNITRAEFSPPGTEPSIRALRRGLPHRQSRAEVQDAENGGETDVEIGHSSNVSG